MSRLLLIFFGFLTAPVICFCQDFNHFEPYTLIAHRGGVVGVDEPENSMAALQLVNTKTCQVL
ncbi:MAG TPA: hypothetical protein VK957_13205 [Lunatimonas sp.]|nr:hypothetical protein [Lunatimonas sp.]